MNKLEKILSKWNFKKIAVWYLIIVLAAGLALAFTVGYIYRERLNFAWQYSRLEEAKDGDALRAAADKAAAATGDVKDVLILDGDGNTVYSAKNSEFALGAFAPRRVGGEKKYFACENHLEAVFQYVKSDEFMLRSIINKDFGKIRSDYDDDSAFDSELSGKTVYMLSRVKAGSDKSTVCVITAPTEVSGGMTSLKLSAAAAMLFFCIYWVLVALWMYKDASKCRLYPLYWGLIGLFTNIIGLIVYKICKRNMALCTVCGTAQRAGNMYCSHCGEKLGRSCESCGGKISKKDIYCPHCGKKI